MNINHFTNFVQELLSDPAHQFRLNEIARNTGTSEAKINDQFSKALASFIAQPELIHALENAADKVAETVNSWATEVETAEEEIENQIQTAKNSNNILLYYQLKNNNILNKITFIDSFYGLQDGILAYMKAKDDDDKYPELKHKILKNLYLEIANLKERTENRKDNLNFQYQDLQIQANIENDLKLVDKLIGKFTKKYIKISEFKRKNSIDLREKQVYFINNQTTCHNAECKLTRFELSLKKCSGCQKVFYCGRECQKKDWPVHKISCKKLY